MIAATHGAEMGIKDNPAHKHLVAIGHGNGLSGVLVGPIW